MNLPQTLINKKIVIFILTLIPIIIAGGLVYLFNSYTKNTSAKLNSPQTTTIELPNKTSVNVTVNNMIEAAPKKTVTTTSIAIESAQSISPKPDVQTASVPVRTTNELMQTQPNSAIGNAELVKPKMLIVSNDNNSTTSENNALTGTDTKIGTGEIDSKLTSKKSPYTIFAGTFIPATMTTGLNSELNGQIVASVRNDVYDSTNGSYLLIPQGSRLIGVYNHNVAYGQNRLIVGWNRVIYPNGTSFLLRGQPGTDLQGFSGVTGDVDNHWGTVFGSSALIGLIFGGMTAATGNQSTNPYQLSAGATIASQVGAQMSQTGLQVVQKGLNIAPTVIISPGYKFNILTTADLILKPYIYK